VNDVPRSQAPHRQAVDVALQTSDAAPAQCRGLSIFKGRLARSAASVNAVAVSARRQLAATACPEVSTPDATGGESKQVSRQPRSSNGL
jgi:hypothetical protein